MGQLMHHHYLLAFPLLHPFPQPPCWPVSYLHAPPLHYLPRSLLHPPIPLSVHLLFPPLYPTTSWSSLSGWSLSVVTPLPCYTGRNMHWVKKFQCTTLSLQHMGLPLIDLLTSAAPPHDRCLLTLSSRRKAVRAVLC